MEGFVRDDELRLHNNANSKKAEATSFLYADKVSSPFIGMEPEGVLGLGPKPRSNSDPMVTMEHLFREKIFGSAGKNMFSLYFG